MQYVFLTEYWRPPGSPGSTGGTLYNYMLVSALAQIGQVKVIALNVTHGPLPDNVELTSVDEPISKFKGFRAFYWTDFLLSILPAKSAGTVLIATTSTNAVIRKAKKRGFKVFSIVQAYEDYGFRRPGSNFLQKIKSFRKLLLTGQCFSRGLVHADCVVTNSCYMQNSLTSSLSLDSPPALLYPPLTLPIELDYRFTKCAHDSVGFVNRAGKNLDFVIELAERVPNKKFYIYGHPLSTQKELPANVVFKGWASDRVEMLKSARVWLMPSLWYEPFGLVAVEAMSQGCKVAVSDRGGLPEAVGRFGKVFCDFNTKDWAEWLLEEGNDQNDIDLDAHLGGFSVDRFNKTVNDIFSLSADFFRG